MGCGLDVLVGTLVVFVDGLGPLVVFLLFGLGFGFAVVLDIPSVLWIKAKVSVSWILANASG